MHENSHVTEFDRELVEKDGDCGCDSCWNTDHVGGPDNEPVDEVLQTIADQDQIAQGADSFGIIAAH